MVKLYRCKRSIMASGHNIGDAFDWWVGSKRSCTTPRPPAAPSDGECKQPQSPFPTRCPNYDWKQERFPLLPHLRGFTLQ